MLKPFDILKRNIKDRRYHVYKKCRHCKTILKLPLPNKRGLKKVKCPECKKKNKFLIRKLKDYDGTNEIEDDPLLKAINGSDDDDKDTPNHTMKNNTNQNDTTNWTDNI